jgi:hypothetical protein
MNERRRGEAYPLGKNIAAAAATAFFLIGFSPIKENPYL